MTGELSIFRKHNDAYIVILMKYSILKTINSVKIANYHLNRFLSASAWSSLSILIISAAGTPSDFTLCCSSHLHGRQFPSSVNKTT